MAEIKFTGVVERLLGTKGVKVVEQHRAKNAEGAWETKGRTFFTVWLGDCQMPVDGSLIEVTGRQKTVFEEYNGEKRYVLHVAATNIKEVTRVPDNMGSNAVGSDSVIPAGWTEIPSTGTPF
jgi:hypothetical protein